MKAQVDRMAAELLERYRHYLSTLEVGLWSQVGFIEFRCTFSLRRAAHVDGFTLVLPADSAETGAERATLIVGTFAAIETRLLEAIEARQPAPPSAIRPPDTGPRARERARLIAKLQNDLATFERIPAHRRAAECADEREQTCRALLFELGVVTTQRRL